MTTNFMSSLFYKASFKIKQAGPDILTGVGIAGVVGGTIMACIATTKLEKTMEPHKKKLEELHESASEMDDSEYRKEIVNEYGKTIWDLVKLYGPAAAVETTAVGCIIKSDCIMKNRNAALAAAYTTISSAFDSYKKRVADRIGEDAEKEIRYGIHDEEIDEEYTDAKGKTKTRKKTVKVMDEAVKNPYSRWFTQGCDGWSKDPGANLMTLLSKQGELNERLKHRGYLFLNEVYEFLDCSDPIRDGQYLGWYYDPSDPTLHNNVDFGIYDCHDLLKCNFVNGFESTILLDFNIDGNIVDRFNVNNSEMVKDYYGR